MAQSPELAGGAGFTFEGAVAAYYLTSLLAETYAAGIDGRIIAKVSQQQRDFGTPLDDIEVDFRGSNGDMATLSLQAKSALVISDAVTNKDFRDVIRDSWATYKKADFRKGIDRFGVVVGDIASGKSRDLVRLCGFARESSTAAHFDQRFSDDGNASEAVAIIKADIVSVLTDQNSSAPTNAEVHEFLAHFVLIQFDFGHDGSTSKAERTTVLRGCLADGHLDQAPLLWSELNSLARDAAGKSGQYDRPRLVQRLAPVVRLRAAASLKADLERITEFSRNSLADIGNDVGGFHIPRADLARELDEALAKGRWVQIRGLAGNGKSVVLRQKVEADLSKGPTLFLHSDRLTGNGWSSFATANSLSVAPLKDLLVEIGAVGSKTLYIDGIDRIAKAQQQIVLDLVRMIVRTPECADWRIVVSLRDTGIEPLRNWLGELLDAGGIETVSVDSLSDEDAEALATAKPPLRSLLFGPEPAQSIVRRPFFAKILAQTIPSDPGATAFEPKSEGDLIDHWWVRGGFNAEGSTVFIRQRALTELASLRAKNIGLPIAVSGISDTTLTVLDQLVSDGIIQHVRHGHSIRFAHDIFFEWALYHALIAKGAAWINTLRELGEPPAIARVVELMSQSEYQATGSAEQSWAATLRLIGQSGMRSQWMRSWLIGPIALPQFLKLSDKFFTAVSADEAELLRKTLVWFQAERTVPNAAILAADLPKDQRIQLADLLGWPSDVPTWRNLIFSLVKRINSLPPRLYPDVLAVFEVWQNFVASVPNPLSKALLGVAATWLRGLDAYRAAPPLDGAPPSIWAGFKGQSDFYQSLLTLIIKASATYPEFTEEVLRRCLAEDDIEPKTLKLFFMMSKLLAASHPALLAEITKKAMLDELPDEKETRERTRREAAAERRRLAREKPPAERTREEERYLSLGVSFFGNNFSDHDFDTLSVDRGPHEFFPTSPLREPWPSLFASAPDEALRLLRELSNHAITAWRQLHRHVRDRQGTPIPLVLEFPWGAQTFWGNNHEYLWSRGIWGPKPIACGYMALEKWCFDQLDSGRPVDDLLRQIVPGNESVAILGTAVTVALRAQHVSDVTLPLATAQRLWHLDHDRFTHDVSGASGSLVGFMRKEDLPHVQAIKAANARPVRQNQLQWLARVFVLNTDFGERAQTAISSFPDDLPYQYEEHRNAPNARQHYGDMAKVFAEVADIKNYRVYKTENEGEVAIVHESPSARTPAALEKVESAKVQMNDIGLLMWAQKSLDNGKLETSRKLDEAIALARQLDGPTLFDTSAHDDLHMRRGGVAATAAVAVQHAQDLTTDELGWARASIMRASKTPEHRDGLWISSASALFHPCIFAARGLGHLLRVDPADKDAAKCLLELVAHPLEEVSLAAVAAAAGLWHSHPKLCWAVFYLAFRLCLLQPRPQDRPRGPSEPNNDPAYVDASLAAAAAYIESGDGWLPFPALPPAWIKLEGARRGISRRPRFVIGDEGIVPDEPEEQWGEPAVFWHSQLAAKFIRKLPLAAMLAGDARAPLLGYLAALFEWTLEKNEPSWDKDDRRDHNASRHYEWTHAFANLLGQLWGLLDFDDVKATYIDRILQLKGDARWGMLSSALSTFLAAYVYDAPSVAPQAMDVVQRCLDRFLQAPSFKRDSYSAGKFDRSDEPSLVSSFLFVEFDHAPGSARFTNGDWTDLNLILPVVRQIVKAGGWSVYLMSRFLTLCDRAETAFPAAEFAHLVYDVLKDGPSALPGWHGTLLPAKIANLIQRFADRDAPLPLEIAQQFLRILDLLVDMGDRRSAALQLSETFRDIRLD